jgi:uncharacterized protein YjbI with pentapeptide repeats
MKISHKEFCNILTKHRLWLQNEEGGERANLTRCDLRNCKFMSGIIMMESGGWEADLSGAVLEGANLSGMDLRFVKFQRADLREANLSDTMLYRAQLNGSDLRRASLKRARICEANLSGADLRETDLHAAYYSFEANLNEAVLVDGWVLAKSGNCSFI